MRAAVPLALLFLALAPPPATAQAEPTLRFALEPGAQLQVGETLDVPFLVEAPCDPELGAAPPVRVAYTVTRQPSGSSATLVPAMDEAAACGPAGTVTFEGVVEVVAGSEAAAYQPQALELEARLSWRDAPARTARESLPVTVQYHSDLEVHAASSELRVRPGDRGAFLVDVDNLGNANTKVSFEAEVEDARYQVLVPLSVTLQSRQAGGTQTATQVRVELQVPRDAQAPQTILLHWRSSYALDPRIQGESGTLALRVVPDGDADAYAPPERPEPGAPVPPPPRGRGDGLLWTILREIPGPSPALALAAVALAALLATRARRGAR